MPGSNVHSPPPSPSLSGLIAVPAGAGDSPLLSISSHQKQWTACCGFWGQEGGQCGEGGGGWCGGKEGKERGRSRRCLLGMGAGWCCWAAGGEGVDARGGGEIWAIGRGQKGASDQWTVGATE